MRGEGQVKMRDAIKGSETPTVGVPLSPLALLGRLGMSLDCRRARLTSKVVT